MFRSLNSSSPAGPVGLEPDGDAASFGLQSGGARIVRFVLEEEEGPGFWLAEASVHRPRRGRIWVAVFTGPEGGQIWRSTGLTDREQALLVARKWEAEARAQRDNLARTFQATSRPRIPRLSAGTGLLTQGEVARRLGMSERGVREVERRALQKLRNDPDLRALWRRYFAGDLDESQRIWTKPALRP